MKSFVIFFLTIVVAVSNAAISGSHRFGYSAAEQKLWKKRHAHCSGPHQSPIAIHSRRTIPMILPAIELIYYHNFLQAPLKLQNNGYTLNLLFEKPENFTQFPYIFGGKLKGEYELAGLHFHWGSKNNRGAEHVINDIRYPIEMHIIHMNRKYQTLDEALDHKDGLAVLAFFYQIRENHGQEIETISRHLNDLDESGGELSLPYTFTLASLIGNIDIDRFYTYRGSLTTPKCNEAVTWIIFPDTLPISLNQIAKFRALSNGIEGLLLLDNYRHLQPLGNRKIYVRSAPQRFMKLERLVTNESAHVHDDEDSSDWYYH